MDHIISEKHGGPTREDNLAYACLSCNRSKGSDIASLTPLAGLLVRFYHPRLEHWGIHFRLGSVEGMTISPLTDEGEATTRILGFNDRDRLLERQVLSRMGRYPIAAASNRINDYP